MKKFIVSLFLICGFIIIPVLADDIDTIDNIKNIKDFSELSNNYLNNNFPQKINGIYVWGVYNIDVKNSTNYEVYVVTYDYLILVFPIFTYYYYTTNSHMCNSYIIYPTYIKTKEIIIKSDGFKTYKIKCPELAWKKSVYIPITLNPNN